MAGQKLSNEIKQSFIDANIDKVPESSKEKFKTWPLDKQYTQMRIYVNKADNTPKSVKETIKFFEGKNPQYTDIDILIKKLEAFRESKKEERKKELEERLENTKKELIELK